VVATPAGAALGVSQGAGPSSTQPTTPSVVGVPLARAPAARHLRRTHRAAAPHAVIRPASTPIPWRGADPLDVQSATTLRVVSASPHRNGMLLLAGAGALALLVLASGAMLRALVRMEERLWA
jgi:hypothetical protein